MIRWKGNRSPVKNNELFNNMRKTVSYIILLIEIVCLFVAFYVPSKRKADHWYEPIIIPDNMQLTLTDDEQFQVLGGETYTVPGGTISVPIQLNYNSVAFYYDEIADEKSKNHEMRNPNATISFDNAEGIMNLEQTDTTEQEKLIEELNTDAD